MLSISFLPPFSSGYYFPYERMMPSSEALSIFGRSIHPSAWKEDSPKFPLRSMRWHHAPAAEGVGHRARNEKGKWRGVYGLRREGALPPDPSGQARRRHQRLGSLHLSDVAAQIRRRFAQRVRPSDHSVRLGHPIRRFAEA